MAINIVVPPLGESVVEATVARWLKREGDPVAVGDALVALETEKVDIEVSAERAGVLARIDRPDGSDVQIGDVLGLLEEGAAAQTSAKGATPPLQEDPAAPHAPAKSPAPGAPQATPAQEDAAPAQATGGDKERATPVAKRIAQEHGVPLTQVPGTGADGRVTRQDVEQYIDQQARGQQAAPAPQPAQAPAQPLSPPRPPAAPPSPLAPQEEQRREERIRMSRRRQTIARRLVEAQRTAAMLTTFNEVDMGAVMELRKRRRDSFKERHGIGLGLSSFFVKAAIGALRAFPRLNAEIQGDEMVVKHYYDIGVAIGAEEGLVVPVLRDADRMSFAAIERAIKEFAERSQAGTLSLEDLRGGTFTITNGGVFGSLLSTPILNTPQVGILGLHKISDRAVVVGGQVVVRPMMYVALSYDHRIVDGREAVQFLVRLKELVEDPENLLLEG